MVGLLAIGFIANMMIRAVDDRFPEPEGAIDAIDVAHLDSQESTGVDGRVAGSWLLPIAWAVVGIPMIYGVYATVTKAASLF